MLLTTKNLHTYYKNKKTLFSKPSWNYALKDFNFTFQEGDFIAIVGESGCGKSTLGNTLAGLLTPNRGSVIYKNIEIVTPKKNQFQKDKSLRRKIQIIFQDPYSSINPKHTIKQIIGSPLKIHKLVNRKNYIEKIQYYLSLVHLNPDLISRYPDELSGGQRQRIGIARAIALEPEILICDEITSALDVSVQAFIVDLLFELKEKLNLTIILITHDLSLVKHISNQVCVMYGGELIEYGNTKDIFHSPKHPYTKALLEAVPTLNRKKKPRILEGEPPNTGQLYPYCIFWNRCPIRKDICKQEKPILEAISEHKNHFSKCFFSNYIE